MLITHDLGVVAEVTDDIAVMYAGKIVEHGPKEAIFAAPRHPYTWGLLQSIPRLTQSKDDPLVPIPGRPPSLINRPTGCAFHPRCPYVEEEHKRIVPQLEPVGGAPGHTAACLLTEARRDALWRRLKDGDRPEQALAAVEQAGAGPGAGA